MPEIETGEVVIPLNLVFTYPVRWSRFKVLRDLVQNFYDAIGRQDWARRFLWAREPGARGIGSKDGLVMQAPGVGFSYEWLLHIGASTKTAGERGRYAGFYGEGFKIAALCAHRDHGWRLYMASRDWEIEVGTMPLRVDGQGLETLCYRLRRRPHADVTELRLTPFSAEDEALLETVLATFYHAENPLLGACIWADETTAFHHRSALAKPTGYPETHDCRGPGIVFAGFQALGSFELPLVVAQHDVPPSSRERESFYRMDVVDTLKAASRRMPGDAAAVVLERLRRYWRSYPRKRYDFDSLHPVVSILVERVAASREARRRFREAHPDLLVVRPVPRTDPSAENRRRQARAWLRTLPLRLRLVQEEFLRLGYPELEQVCEDAGGFARLRALHDRERPYVELLGEVAVELFPELVPSEGLPPTRIIPNVGTAWKGLTGLLPLSGQRRGARGRRLRYRHQYIAVDQRLLRPGRFGEALSTYLHELAHAYGGDRSAAFSVALTDVLEAAVDRADALTKAKNRWDSIVPGQR